jgi:hypothetical protein
LVLVTPSYEAGAATISVFPSSITAYVDQNVSIDVNVTGVSDLYGWEFKLNWTANILNSVNVTEGPFLKSDGNSTFFYYYLNATAGQITVDCTRLGNILGVSGSGVLASIKFNVKSSRQSPLNLYYAILVNSQEHQITSQLNSGNVYSSFTPDSAEFSTFLFYTVIHDSNTDHSICLREEARVHELK